MLRIAVLMALVTASSPVFAQPASETPAEHPAPPAAAGDDEAIAESARLLQEGRDLFSVEANFEEALDRFRRSYARRPNWQALVGIASVHQMQGRYVDAVEIYEQLLREFRSVLTKAEIADAEGRLAEHRKRIAMVELTVGQLGVRVTLDGVEIGTGPLRRAVRVLPGPHTVIATRAGHEALTRALEPAAGATVSLEIILKPSPVRIEQAPLVRPMRPWIPWTTAGAGALTVGIAALVQRDASSDYAAIRTDVMNMWGDDQLPVMIDGSRLRRAETKNVVAISLYAVGGAAIITGVVLAIVNQPRARRRPERPHAALVLPSPRSIALSFSF